MIRTGPTAAIVGPHGEALAADPFTIQDNLLKFLSLFWKAKSLDFWLFLC